MNKRLFTSKNSNSIYRSLVESGFAILPGAIEHSLISELQQITQDLIAEDSNAHLQEDQFTGSLIPVAQSPHFRHLISHTNIQSAFRDFGFHDPRWLSGYIISKPPKSPSLGWHQDCWFWNHSIAYSGSPPQIFAMIYLTDTFPHNGCLKAIPQTHLYDHPLHEQLGRAHSDEVRSASNDDYTSKPEHNFAEGEMDICIKAGDVVFGDARLLHGARSNESDERRTVITLWYFPVWNELPDQMKEDATMLHFHQMAEDLQNWSSQEISQISHLLPVQDAGSAYTAFSRIGAEYDHNLGFMVRDPGWVEGRDVRSENAYKAHLKSFYQTSWQI